MTRNTVVMTLVAASCLSFCARNKGRDQANRIETDDVTGVIFDQSAAAYISGEGEGLKRWTPTIEEALEADGIAARCLKEDAPEVFKNLKSYKRQYVGFFREGKKYIFINYFWVSEDRFKNWDSVLVKIKDGGRYFLEIKVDLRSGSCKDLYVHGEA